MESDLSKFKHVLEYFVTHLNFKQSGDSDLVTGFHEYIKPLLDNGSFQKSGLGYKDYSIQKQIRQWDNICSHHLCINIQPLYNYRTKRCYLNWEGTGINVYCKWNDKEAIALQLGYSYWWQKPTGYEIKLERSISELGLFEDSGNTAKLEEFFNRFVQEITDYDQERGDYYFKELEYRTQIKQKQMNEQIQDYINLLHSNHNLILTGAPGTGKTYLAKQIAAQMILGKEYDEKCEEDKKIMDEQCGFVQFHPSYDYTDFVEGLRPIQDDNGNVGFERKDGVFKEFCKKALLSQKVNAVDNFNEAWDKLVEDLNENQFIEIPFLSDKTKSFRVELNEYGTGLANRTYQNDDFQKGEWIKGQSKFFSKDQLYNIYRGLKGVPSGGHDNYRRAIIEELKNIFGLEPYQEGNTNSDKNTETKYVFIIDEINRGEISKIFGELFFSIDPSYRGEKKGRVQTQYQNLVEDGDIFKKGFFVPENVYIIGTMNDIDRSVESMDFAFRRRFAFKEVTATDSQKMLDSDDAWDSKKPNDEIITSIKNRMDNLNNKIWHKPTNEEKDEDKSIAGLSSSYHIGASYFLKLKDYNGDFDKLWEYHLEGLLREYLRGMTDVDAKIEALHKAYDNEADSDNGQQQ